MSWSGTYHTEAIPTRLNRASFSSCKFKIQSQYFFRFLHFKLTSLTVSLRSQIPHRKFSAFYHSEERSQLTTDPMLLWIACRPPSLGTSYLLLNSNLGAAGSMSNMPHCFWNTKVVFLLPLELHGVWRERERRGSKWEWVQKWKDRLPQPIDVTHTRYCPCQGIQPIKKLKRRTESLLLSTFPSCLLVFHFPSWFCVCLVLFETFMWVPAYVVLSVWEVAVFVCFKCVRFSCFVFKWFPFLCKWSSVHLVGFWIILFNEKEGFPDFFFLM